MTYPRNDRLSITLALAAIAEILIGFALFFLCTPAQPQPRITPKVVCERNGGPAAGWVYVPATNQCYGPGTHALFPLPDTVAPTNAPAPEPLCRFHTRRDGKRTVSEWMPCKQITKCRKPCWIEREKVK
jgi:hypothetical protein